MDRTFTNGSDRKTTMTARALRCAAPLAALLVVLAACGQSATKSPRDARAPGVARSALDGQPACAGNGAHAAHVQGLGLDCSACHPGGARYGFANVTTYPRGTTSAGGSIVPSTPSSPASCSVGCHSPMGAPPHVVEWTAPGPLACTACHDTAALPPAHPAASASATRADCQGCHDTGSHTRGTVALAGHDASWMDRASAGFHAFAAERGLSRCRACHSQDLSGGVTGSSCASCHRSGGQAASADFSTCTGCHGGGDNATGAPPRAIWGRGSDAVRVGAHTTHVTASPVSPAIGCATCHAPPADLFAPGHIDELTDPAAVPTAGVEFGGLATLAGAAPSWDRANGKCASTYCHGNFPGGNTTYAPTWTSPAANACGTCHGLPPGGNHPGVDPSAGLAACSACHAETIAASGQVIAPASGGKHLDGLVEAAGHPGEWMSTASTGFHAYSANANIASCQGCHGTNLDGVGGTARTACARCHDGNLPAGVASWNTNCVMCHGGAHDQTGAPPKAIWGHAGDPSRGGGTADPVRVGAHSAHVNGASNGTPLSPPFDCGVCHVKPTDALSAGHLDGTTATVTFAGLASQGATPTSAPRWTRADATCANTYCHGATLHGGANVAPAWTGGALQAACGSCHGVPPPASTGHVQKTGCGSCHPGYTQTSVNAATHVNGTIEIVGLTCTTCHGDATRAATTLNPQLPAAPPLDTMGNAATTSPRVGAHQAHLRDGALRGALACTECHAVPASTATHPTGTLDLAWGPLATAGGAAPAYAGGACSSTYCHGATLQAGGTNQAPAWTGGSAEAACGTCHGLPPPNPPHPIVAGGLTACSGCHSATIDATGTLVSPAAGGKHLDGVLQATAGHGASWTDPASPGFHAYAANQGLGACKSCHGANLDGVGGTTAVACAQCHAPGGSGRDFTTCTGCHGGADNASGAPPAATWGHAGAPDRGGGALDPVRVGAHSVHVTGGPIAQGFGCDVCHVTPGSMLDPGHVDQPTATVTFGGIASAGTAPAWSRSTATCSSTYCHGATLAGGTTPTPIWTVVDGSQDGCTACHGGPPSTGRHLQHAVSWGIGCRVCHPVAPGYLVDPALHVNGAKDLNQSPTATRYGGFADWNPAAPGEGTLQGTATACHGGVNYWTGSPPPTRYGCK